jgi:hypothetical protein
MFKDGKLGEGVPGKSAARDYSKMEPKSLFTEFFLFSINSVEIL